MLLNPTAGASRGPIRAADLAEMAEAYGCRTVTSRYAGELTQLARQEVEAGTSLLIAAGGDDTVREVLFGMDQAGAFRLSPSQRPFLGILPLGTFNNFARYLGVPLDIPSALEAAHHGQTTWIDLGRAAGFLFTESVGVGVDVAAWKAFPRESPSLLRRLWDGAVAVIKAITVFRPKRYFLEVDGQFASMKAYNITIANASHFSASIAIAPHAVKDDGYLDLCIIPALSKLRFVLALPLIFLGKHTAYLKGVRYQRVRHVRLGAERSSTLRIDGRLGPRLPLEVEVQPQVLPIRLPVESD